MAKFFLRFILSTSLLGCSSVSFVPGGHDPGPVNASFEEYFDFWFLGFYGSHPPYDMSFLCPKQRLTKIQTLHSVEDVLIGVFTIGIYTPRTVRVWCAPAQTTTEARHAP